MAQITLGGNATNTIGNLPEIGTKAPEFTLSRNDLSTTTLEEFNGKRVVLNIFPSVDTGVCAQSVRTFNEKVSSLANTEVLCISRDLPFAQARFCAAEGLENVHALSDFKTGKFGVDYGVTIEDGSFAGLHSRAIVVLDENAKVLYTEQVPEIGQEPNYESAVNALS
ncbi:thiol peroxidase [Dokdonia sp. Hel_I_53]|uniref:thiol peroxidase n=1 Tax=Dokdonia sp. Hel_I_53 TaxID=1566287 RepID=UPI001199230F|nr:thiol peroxidase [Dokdonia sp. Hel_I_53]TVZ50945.1 thiol peroxidase (atypical 2-Cys peroxiredoxin) [Dokdonia sp. Hel_I_53]